MKPPAIARARVQQASQRQRRIQKSNTAHMSKGADWSGLAFDVFMKNRETGGERVARGRGSPAGFRGADWVLPPHWSSAAPDLAVDPRRACFDTRSERAGRCSTCPFSQADGRGKC